MSNHLTLKEVIEYGTTDEHQLAADVLLNVGPEVLVALFETAEWQAYLVENWLFEGVAQ